eukprot:bmy_21494T0
MNYGPYSQELESRYYSMKVVVGACCGMMKLLQEMSSLQDMGEFWPWARVFEAERDCGTVLPSCPRRLPGATNTGLRITYSSSGPRRFPAQDFGGTAGHRRSQEGEAAAQGPEGGQAGLELPEQVGAVRDPLEEDPEGMKRARAEASGDCDAEDPGGTPGSRGSQPPGGGGSLVMMYFPLGGKMTYIGKVNFSTNSNPTAPKAEEFIFSEQNKNYSQWREFIHIHFKPNHV